MSARFAAGGCFALAVGFVVGVVVAVALLLTLGGPLWDWAYDLSH